MNNNINDRNNKQPNTGKMIYNICLLVSGLAIVSVFAYMMVYTVFLSRTQQSNYDKNLTEVPEFSFSSLFSGEYTTHLSKYFTDTVHGRDNFKEGASIIKSYYGIEQEEEDFFVGDNFPPEDIPDFPDVSSDSSTVMPPETSDDTSGGVSTPDVSDPSGDTSQPVDPPKPPTQPPAEEILNNITLLGTGSDVRAMEVFYHNENNAIRYAKRISDFAAKVSGVNVYSMVIPKACAYYIEGSKKYGSTALDSWKTDQAIKNNLNGVIYVSAYEALEAHKDEEIYARTDHHWTGLGAFYAAEEFAKTAGVSFAPMSEYDINRRPGYVGTMYTFTKSAKLLNNPEDFITLVPKVDHKANFYNKNYQFITEHDIFWYIGDNMRSGWYSTFLGSDEYIAKIKSPVCTNGRKLLIIKDSYGNALSPLFLSSFEEIYIGDLRYMNVNILDFIENNGITDVLFAMCSYSAVGDSTSKRIETLTTIGR